MDVYFTIKNEKYILSPGRVFTDQESHKAFHLIEQQEVTNKKQWGIKLSKKTRNI